jgi:septal ring factor EnvC (AmiA/AmiB activator)
MTDTQGELTAPDDLAVTRRRLSELQAATLVDLRSAGAELEQLRTEREQIRAELQLVETELTDSRARLDETTRRLAAVTASGSYRLSRALRLLVHPVEARRRVFGRASR